MKNVHNFFDQYQKANEDLDIDLIGLCYGDNFLFGQPQGVQPVTKVGFLNILPKRKTFFQTIGLKSSRVYAIDTKELDAHYVEATVQWKMQFEKNDKTIIEIAKATYILYKRQNSYEIVVQIDHQDLMEKVKELGLL